MHTLADLMELPRFFMIFSRATAAILDYQIHTAAHFLFHLVSRRYQKGSIILTSNKSFGEWGEIFTDAVLATAILDRLLHHATTINIRGNSYRLRQKQRAGLPADFVLPPQEDSPAIATP